MTAILGRVIRASGVLVLAVGLGAPPSGAQTAAPVDSADAKLSDYLPKPSELRARTSTTDTPGVIDFAEEIAGIARNASAYQHSRLHVFETWAGGTTERHARPDCGGYWCNLTWDTWFTPSYDQPHWARAAHQGVMRRHDVRLAQYLVGPLAPETFVTTANEGQSTDSFSGYGGLLPGVWFGVQFLHTDIEVRPLGSTGAYDDVRVVDVEATAFGISAHTRPDPLAGSARWEGVMVGGDVGGVVARRFNLIQGDAILEVDFASLSLDVTFANVRDVTADTERADMVWTDVPIDADGRFEATGATAAEYLVGNFYHRKHAAAAGVFERDSIVGAFGAWSSSRATAPEIYAGLADKLADVARHERRYRPGTEGGTTAWHSSERRDPASGAEQITWSQTYAGGYFANSTVPWRTVGGDLKFHFDAYVDDPVQEAPLLVSPGRFVALGDHYRPRRGSDLATVGVYPELGTAWEALRATQTYGNGAFLTVELVTDLGRAEASAAPWIRDFSSYSEDITLDGVPAMGEDVDYLWVPVPADGLSGTRNGEQGTFTCTESSVNCGLVRNPRDPAEPGWFVGPVDLTFAPAGGGAAVTVAAAPNAAAVPRTDYLAFGNWQFVPADTTDAGAFAYGVYAAGGDPFHLENLAGLEGSASYVGAAVGKYARAPALGGSAIESFTADVELTAEFGTSDARGEIGGRLFNFAMTDGHAPPVSGLTLVADSWRGGDNIFETYDGGDPKPGGWVEGYTQGTGADGRWNGAWGGAFFGNDAASADAHPTGFGGTFGASDGAGSLVGSFGAQLLPPYLHVPSAIRNTVDATEAAAVDFRERIAEVARNASTLHYSRAHRVESWQEAADVQEPRDCGGRWCFLPWVGAEGGSWFSPLQALKRIQSETHESVLRRNGVAVGQSFLAGTEEAWTVGADEGFVRDDLSGYGGLLPDLWFGVLLRDSQGRARPSGSSDSYDPYSIVTAEAMVFGTSSFSRPAGPSGTARWTGVMVGRDIGPSEATRHNLVQGDAILEYDFADLELDVTFENIVDVAAGTDRTDMTWTGIAVEDGGAFADTGDAGAAYVRGSFYGAGQAGVGGVFERDSVVGAFGAWNSGRYVAPRAHATYLGLADKLADAARYSRRYAFDIDAEATAWHFNQQAPDSGSVQATWSQSSRYSGAAGSVVPWRADGDLKFFLEVNFELPVQHAPVEVYSGRYVIIDPSHLNRTRTAVAATAPELGLGDGWEAIQATQNYRAGGTLEVRLVTDLAADAASGEPWVQDFTGHDDDISLDGVEPLRGDRDYLFVPVPEAGLAGSLDGADGRFACAGASACAFLHDPTEPDNPGFYPTRTMRFTPDDGGVAVTVAGVRPSAETVAKTDYLSFGDWQFVPEDIDDLAAYDYGVFASGGDPFDVTRLAGLTGTASYEGEAVGKYALAPALGGTGLASFTAEVELTADFGSATALGEIGGRVFNFAMTDGQAAPLSELTLQPDSWRGDANIFLSYPDGPPLPGGWAEGFTQGAGDDWKWGGTWGGAFFGNDADSATTHPAGFGGTFGASDGASSLAGSFGAHRE